MYKTTYGDFNGDLWENFCQVCFKLKYEDQGYQELPAWQGDMGIEGFTRTGIVFQCYCPDMDYNPDVLYEKQRDKVTTDLNKLIANETQLENYLKGIQISKWILVVPEYKKKDLVRHCGEKAEELRGKKCKILAQDFDVLVHDIEFFAEQIPTVLSFQKKKIDIEPGKKTEQEIADWKSKQISLVDTTIRKHEQRVPSTTTDFDGKVNKLTQYSISYFLNGDIMLKKWKENFQDQYEKFIKVVEEFEKKVEERCAVYSGDNNQLYSEIEKELNCKLKNSFEYLDDIMIDRLTNYVMADWIMRCPISFG